MPVLIKRKEIVSNIAHGHETERMLKCLNQYVVYNNDKAVVYYFYNSDIVMS